jgi:hypothetical protein
MLAFMLCVVDFVLTVIGHFMLEGDGGMDQKTPEHKYSTCYILAFHDYSSSLSILSSAGL